ncbi:MAG: pyridoxal kinase PdxY [Treponema sp.]|nr:pyridoxal kinase PdxY [Treponema sp.]
MAVLSIQSHVVYGYAGNTAAVFPMQRLGNEVWAVNTVEFSNHTGYGSWRGKILGAELAADLITALEERNVLDKCDAVLSGYLGGADIGKVIHDAVKKARKYSPNVLYCCDPVMGDIGRGLYVKPDIPEIFKNELVPLADIVCPNQFEIETLTDVKVDSLDSAVKAINILHNMGPSIVLLTSYKEENGCLGIIASDKNQIYKITTPELPIGNNAAGTGDMTAAVFLSRFLETKNLSKTLELCTASVYSILEESYNYYKDSEKKLELRIINAQDQLISPSHYFKAEKIK